jgi:uncharacterized Zn finger protein (UPF0148 family)
MKSSNKIDGVKRTGEMLLQGWRMLSDSCPICYSPLMSKGNSMKCPGCDLPVKKESDESLLQSCQSSEKEKNENSAIQSVQEPASFEELKREYDRKNQAKNIVSSKLGELMLSGWTLLAESCPNVACSGTPLVRASDKPMHCVACNSDYQYSPHDGELISLKAASKVGEVSRDAAKERVRETMVDDENVNETESEWLDSVPHFPIMSHATDKNDASYKISQKLLSGWTLLDSVCPIDNEVPLMRDGNGKVTTEAF